MLHDAACAVRHAEAAKLDVNAVVASLFSQAVLTYLTCCNLGKNGMVA